MEENCEVSKVPHWPTEAMRMTMTVRSKVKTVLGKTHLSRNFYDVAEERL